MSGCFSKSANASGSKPQPELRDEANSSAMVCIRVLPLPVLIVGCPPSFQYGDERRNPLSNVRGRCVCAWGTTSPVSTVGQESVEQVEMAPAILIVMLAAPGINILLFRASPAAAVKGSIMNASMVALISI